MMGTVQYTEVPFSWPIMLSLAAIFLGSTATFFVLVRRWTLNRQWTYMSEWARERRFRHRPTDEILPAPIDTMPSASCLCRSPRSSSRR